MILKNLFFNIMKEDFKRRLWTVALISLFFFFAFPVTVAMLVSDYMQGPQRILFGFDVMTPEMAKLELTMQFEDWMSVGNGLVVTFIFVFAVLCGVTGFSYLHSKKKTDFFHSIPVKREKLFAALFINGILYTAVPYLISLLFAVGIVGVKTGIMLPWADVFSTYLFQMAFYTMIYATIILAVILTGNTIVSLLGMLIFCSWGPALVGIITAYCQEYFKTYYFNSDWMELLLVKSSPFAWYIHSVIAGGSGARAFSALAIAFVLCALSVVLYRLRPSEAAGRAMAFKKSEPVIKFMIVIPMALFGSMVFRQMRNGEDIWSVFGLMCGCIITYCIIEIIYNFDFRRMFSHKIQLAVCGVVSLAIIAFFQFDLLGYDSYIPSKNKVESAAVYSYSLNGDALQSFMGTPELLENSVGQYYLSISEYSASDYLKKMQLKNTDDVLFLAQAGINSIKIREDESAWSDSMQGDTIEYTGVDIKYHMKNGRDIFRSYQIPLQETEQQLGAIYNTPEYKTTTYPVLGAGNPVDYVGANYEECNDYSHINFADEAMKTALITTYQEELLALPYMVRKVESPIATLQFKTRDFQDMIDIVKAEGYGSTRFNNWGYYPIYPSFTKTIAILKECGINPGTYLNRENIEKIELMNEENSENDWMDTYSAEMPQTVTDADSDLQKKNTMIIKDKAQIEELLNACIFEEYVSMNQLNETESRISIIAYVKKELEDQDKAELEYRDRNEEELSVEYQTFRLYFDQDKVPEFVKKQMLEQ